MAEFITLALFFIVGYIMNKRDANRRLKMIQEIEKETNEFFESIGYKRDDNK